MNKLTICKEFEFFFLKLIFPQTRRNIFKDRQLCIAYCCRCSNFAGKPPHVTKTVTRPDSVIGKRFLPNGPFSAFFNDFEIFNGPFLIILHRLLWAIFQVNGTMAHGPLPSQSRSGYIIMHSWVFINPSNKNCTCKHGQSGKQY